MLVLVSAVAGLVAWSPASLQAAAPRPISFFCTFEKGVVVVVEPSRRRAVVTDAGRSSDQFGQIIQDSESNRLVAVLTARAVTSYACKRVSPTRRLRTTHLLGPWTARVFSRVLCGYGGKSVRLDVFPVRGGGYRLTIAGRPSARVAFLAVEVRPRGGGIWLEQQGCIRLSK